jgi:hypothetical protein
VLAAQILLQFNQSLTRISVDWNCHGETQSISRRSSHKRFR